MQKKWDRNEILHLLTLSASLSGLSITSFTIFKKVTNETLSATIADDILAFSSLLFLVATYLFFFSLRTKSQILAEKLELFGDIIFLAALTAMVGTSFLVLYTVL